MSHRYTNLTTIVPSGFCGRKAGMLARLTGRHTGYMQGHGAPCTSCPPSCCCWPSQSAPSTASRAGGCPSGATQMHPQRCACKFFLWTCVDGVKRFGHLAVAAQKQDTAVPQECLSAGCAEPLEPYTCITSAGHVTDLVKHVQSHHQVLVCQWHRHHWFCW